MMGMTAISSVALYKSIFDNLLRAEKEMVYVLFSRNGTP